MPAELRFAIGQTAEHTRQIRDEDIRGFAQVTGDVNPVHLDEEYARRTPFEGRIAHGILGVGLISAVLGTQLPGPGAIYLSQSARFIKPVRPGDTILVRVEVVRLHPEKPIVTLDTRCFNQAGEVVLEGEAVLLCPVSPSPAS